MRPLPALASALIPVLALLAGCGGGDPEQDVRQVVRDFATAVNERDGERFCNDLTTREYVEAVTAARGESAVEQCERQIDRARQPEFRVVRFLDTRVDGDRAVVVAQLDQQGRTRRQVFRLAKEDGDFRLTSGAPGG